jgi:hypothetical protein
MACKDKCCCPVKRRPAKKRKSTVGKVSATQLLAQSIASLALPRKVNEVFLYGNSPLGEAQRFVKSEPLVSPAVATAPLPAVVKPEIVKPAKYSRQQIQPIPARAEQLVEEPKGRFTERTQFFNTIGKTSNVATPIENVISKPVKERKSYSSMTDDVSKPAEQSSALTNQYFTGTLLERTPQELPTLRNLNDDKFFKELTTRQKYAMPSITNTFSGNLPAPVNLNLTEGGKGRKIPGLKGVTGYKELTDFEFTNAGRPKKVDIGRAII